MASEKKDVNLAPSGEKKIEWVKRNCDLLRTLEEEFTKTRPFEGKKIALSVHLEAKTSYLCKVLAAGGAQMFVTVSNPFQRRMMWLQPLLKPVSRFTHGTGPHRKNMRAIYVRSFPRDPT